MVPEVKVISRETVKPSSPTPDHLRRYQLSFLDQISPPFFMAMVFFYPHSSSRFSTSHTTDISNKLKQSLSENLVRFYPLAGRVKEEEFFYIDCNDEGVPYIEARVKGQLSETIRDPLPIELHKLYPYELHDIKDLAVAVQINFFDCGGVALTVLISHKVADGLSYFQFVNSWAATSRRSRDGGGEIVVVGPQFGSAALFPQRSLAGFKSSIGMVKENIETRRFVFSASSVAALRAKYSNSVRRPTRVEALSAFLWTRYMAVIKEDINPNSIYTVLHAVNFRPRVEPPLPAHFFGNMSQFVMSVPVQASRNIEKEESYDVVNPMRDAAGKVNGEYITKLREGNGKEHLDFLKGIGERSFRGEVIPFTFTSLCRFPLYEADFGWGKPVWVGSGRRTYRNLVTFVDTRSGDGIEAFVNLTEADMAKFEKDKELLAFTSSLSTP